MRLLRLPMLLLTIGGCFGATSGCSATGVNVTAEDAIRIVKSASESATAAVASEARRAGEAALVALKDKAIDLSEESLDRLLGKAESWVREQATKPPPAGEEGSIPNEAIWGLPLLYALAEGRKWLRDNAEKRKAKAPPAPPAA
jgi:hypothetical protein